MKPIYLDYNATTPVDPAVLEAMMPYLTEHFGNAASAHAYGEAAAAAVTRARAQVATLIGAAPAEIVFTGSASESNNLALKGAAFALRDRGRHLVTSQVEHPATLNACRYLEREFGFDLTIVPVGPNGSVNPSDLEQALRPDTTLVSIMHAQNETGVLQPIADIGRILRPRGILFHVDAAQTLGKVPVDVGQLGCDLLTVAGHKLYAPKGIGALYVRSGVELHSLIHGTGYEGGRRAGTTNVPYAVALGTACELAGQKLAAGEADRLTALRDRLAAALSRQCDFLVNGHPSPRLPNTLNISIPGVVGNDLLAAVPEVAASTGSACHAGVSAPNPTLLAMGLPEAIALGALRLTLGRYSTADEVERAAVLLGEGARRLQSGGLRTKN